jgi:streptomycin 6-kinase
MKSGKSDILIPDYFKAKIRRCFGIKGANWLSRLDELLNRCLIKWNLANCHLAADLSMNLVCFADSPDYGSVVIKIGVPHPELYTEMTALSLYNGGNICLCYDSDIDIGAMLLERVIPGHNLTVLQHERECIEIAVDVISTLPIPVSDDNILPSFSDWLEKASSRVRRENKVGKRWLFFVDQAERLFQEIDALERKQVLLHGDLHHENILYGGNGQWKAIDPKGVIGIPCMEAARFIQNQLEKVNIKDKLFCLDEMVTVFGTAFDRPKRTIAICAFIDCVLSRCWTFEEYLEPEELSAATTEAINSSEFYLNFIKNI